MTRLTVALAVLLLTACSDTSDEPNAIRVRTVPAAEMHLYCTSRIARACYDRTHRVITVAEFGDEPSRELMCSLGHEAAHALGWRHTD